MEHVNGTCDLNFIWTNFTVNANKWKVTCSALSIQQLKKKKLNISKKEVSLNKFSRQVIFSKTTRPKPLTSQMLKCSTTEIELLKL